MKRILQFSLILALVVPALASAAGKEEDPNALPPGALYRYTTEQGRMVITSTLPSEAIYTGYEIIDGAGRVIRSVEAAMPEEERLRRRDELMEEIRRKEEDEKLRKLYSTPADAERARDRQVQALSLNIDYAKSSISQAEEKLETELVAAAQFEKAGKEVPETNKAAISQLNRQIEELRKEIASHEAAIEKTRAKFEPIISRLSEIENGEAKDSD